jgi:serpin B
MLLLLPEQGRFAEFEAALDATRVEEIVGEMSDYQVALGMPKFEFELSTGLGDVLRAMGMQDAFAPGVADFSGMDGGRDLFIQDVLHKAFIKLDEEGTEAAAATAVVVGITSMPREAAMTVDRPFVFLIRDRTSGTVLFAGRVLDPEA